MEGPPTFVASIGVPRGGVEGMKQIPLARYARLSE